MACATVTQTMYVMKFAVVFHDEPNHIYAVTSDNLGLVIIRQKKRSRFPFAN